MSTEATIETTSPASGARDGRGRFQPGNAAGKGPRSERLAARRVRRGLRGSGFPVAWIESRVGTFLDARRLLENAATWTPAAQAEHRAEILDAQAVIREIGAEVGGLERPARSSR